MKNSCKMDCGISYPLLLQFLKPPDQLNDNQEVETKDWNEWASAGNSYGRVKSKSSREVLSANQTHGQVDAVVFAPWGQRTKDITNENAIKVNGSYYHIIGAVNVDEMNQEMMFVCRKRTL